MADAVFLAVATKAILLSMSTLIHTDFSASGVGDPEVKRIIFIDKYKPTHVSTPGPDDPNPCDFLLKHKQV